MPLGTPYNGQYGEVPPERGTMFRLRVYDRVTGISLVEVYERVGKSIISVLLKDPKIKRLTDAFMAVKKSRKRSGLLIFKRQCIYSS